MIRLQTLGLATLLGFAGAVLAQTPSPSTTTNTDARTSSSQSDDTLGQQPGNPTTTPSSGQSQDPATTGTPPISGSDTSPSTTPPSGSATPPATSSDEDSMSSDSMRTASASDTMKSAKGDKHRVSKLIGKNVETSTGDTIGEVKDLVIDDMGKVTHLIVSHGRLGSTKLAAVPYDAAKQMMRGDKLVMDKTRLENAPSFEESSYPDMSSTTWSSSADRYWERSRSASAAGASDTGSTGSASSDPATDDASSTSDPASSTPGTPDSSMPPSSPDSTTPSTDPADPTDPTTTEPSSTETPPPG